MLFVERIDGGEIAALALACNTVWAGEVENRIAERAQLHALIFGRQEAAVPLPGGDGLRIAAFAGGHHHDETWKIIRLTSETVGHP